jgi:hypothetical protein
VTVALPFPPLAILDEASRRDPLFFAERCGLTPDPWQADVLTSTKQQLLLNCSRQAGKSTTSSLLALHTALYGPPAPVLLVSPSLRQSQELFRKVKDACRALDVEPAEESALRMEFANGSRIISLPGNEATIRGFSGVGLLIVDEASRVPDELYYAVRPMLAVSGGRIALLSTPFGRRGFFFKEWTEGEDWHRVSIKAEDVPRIPKDWLEEERRSIGPWWFAQEYGCEFKDTVDQVFRSEDIDAAVSDDIEPLFEGGIRA